ncbi:MAG TPA: tyrosine--tRNA ligase [Polyangiaceae bacterium LLY-WYZ-15_(1-7)]|nr:tyrosine--tRNA ligase [Sandaracinus sp.]HJL03419.1 tyrosine--tRNA ligase [Polyangiaceae bacterium LLY-WYZ-15_(1-7)]HJL13978.1 tyrosine--tRNA ligase [Polyangiaceae bacterium LLY-WYZ-15_(1-7)]HJL26414.1 tyrosine--tRNA ligase [Polyangiaceae bacterium LLY-WYZ-15_(1-7)]HJL29445.1 tyrosine--tRNA ligase [Polyangiaceae bacterium LLY-WYZ-15_(1-7)]
MAPTPEEQLAILTRGVVDLHVEEELLARLKTGRPLKVKAGFDPTRPDLHLGHTVLMQKMRQFQELGHEVIFIVGDFTAQIGDPTGRSATRPIPTREEILDGAKTYAEQAFKILDREQTRLVYNSEWLGEMRFDDVIRLAGKYTLARMMERDDFKTRWAENRSISIHELLYPLAQAYDSVELECDVELGGTDQLFNLLVGRELMRQHGQKPQIVMTTPILEGLDAREEDGKIVGDKMSKSLDNYVGITEPPEQQLGKLMSVSDALMWRYYELLSDVPMDEVKARKAACASGEANPRDVKMALAKEIVGRYHDDEAAAEAERKWVAQFSKRQVPEDLREVTLEIDGDGVWIPKALADAGVLKSSSEGKRRLKAGAIQVDGEKVTDPQAQLAKGGRYVVKAGKRDWAAITVK